MRHPSTLLLLLLPFLVLSPIQSYSETEPNDGASSANTMNPNSSDIGNIGGTDIMDWWKIMLGTDGVVNLNLASNASLVGAYLQLFDQDGTSLLNSVYLGPGTSNVDMNNLPLSAGTYYVKVHLYSGSDGYTLSNTYTADVNLSETEPNDEVATANIIVTNDSQRGNVGYSGNGVDNQDWWNITTSDDGVLQLSLTSDDKTTGAYLQLYDQNGTSLLYSVYLEPGSSTIAIPDMHLSAGTYYIRVALYSGYDGYTLTNIFTGDINLDETEPNDDHTSANIIAPNDSKHGNIGYSGNGVDIQDWWTITLQEDGIIQWSLTSDDQTTGSYLQLFDNDGTSLIYSVYLEPGSSTVVMPDMPLSAGVYFIKVALYSYHDGYTLSNVFTSDKDLNETEPNDLAKDAKSISVNGSVRGNIGYFGKGTDIIDWWQLDLPEDGAVKFSLKGDDKTVGAYLVLIGQDSVSPLWSIYLGLGDSVVTSPDVLTKQGTYFLRVALYSYYDEYTVSNTFTPVPKANFGFVQNISTFSFIDSSSDATAWAWDFGDGNKATGANPSHKYAEPGTYNVCVAASNIAGSDTFCRYAVVEGIAKVVSNKAGNTGDATILVYGGGFTDQTNFYLKKSGSSDIMGTTHLVEPGVLQTTFDLRGKQTGMWDVVVETPSQTTLTLAGGFTIEAGEPAEPWVNVVGRHQILFNRWQTYTINYGNNSNVDASGVPLWIVISRTPQLDVEFVDFEIVLNQYAIDQGWGVIADSVPLYYEIDSLQGEPFAARVYPLYIPSIPAGQAKSIKIRIKSDKDIRVLAWVNNPLFQSPMSEEAKACIQWAQAKALATGLSNYIPGAGCIMAVTTNYIYDPFAYPMPDVKKTRREQNGSMLWNLATTFLACATDVFPVTKAIKVAVTVTNLAADIQSAYTADQDCKNAFDRQSQQDRSIRAVSSFDPNEKTGPGGFNTNNYSLKHDEFPYTIFFENKPTATAPAQEVFVTDTLDMAVYDLSTFSFGPLGFADTLFYPHPGLKAFTQDVDLRPKKEIILRVNAELDESTGGIYWQFISLDPATMDLTEDPQGGFLNPNVISPEGEGSVSFTVGLKSSLGNGALIKNKANIVFDLNAPILTNEWKNTLDLQAPSSKVNAVSSSDGNKIDLSWSGTDAQSGIQYYHIYVSENDSAFVPLFSYTGELSASFTGNAGSHYKFYSIAEDSVGNTETKSGHDITFSLGIDDAKASTGWFEVAPNPVQGTSQLYFYLSKPENIRLVIKDMLGRDVRTIANGPFSSGNHSIEFNGKGFEGGIYFISMEMARQTHMQKIIIAQ